MCLQGYDADNAYMNTSKYYTVFTNNTIMYINSNALCLLYYITRKNIFLGKVKTPRGILLRVQ